MTCIAALECLDGGVIGGDYCGSNGKTYQMVVPSKVFEHSNMLFGYTSTFRFGQIIEHILDNKTLYPPDNPHDTYRWLVKDFVPKLRKVMSDEGYNFEKGCHAALLVNGQAWELQNDLSVFRNDAGLVVVGSGENHAQSSILTQLFMNCPDVRPTMDQAEEILELAFEVTGSCVTSVSKKVNIIRSALNY